MDDVNAWVDEQRLLDPVFKAYDDIIGWVGVEVFDPLAEIYESGSAWLGESMDSLGNWLDETGALISNTVNDAYTSALNFIPRADPLTLDLDGDGLETVASNSGITFDFDGDGLKTGTGWVGKDDGFLVLDRNNNGRIDTGAELFGVDTLKRNGQKATNGFDALRDLDSNNDGVFNASDAQFANVRVWQDLNQDGISQANELKSLAERHITSITLTATTANQTSNGNTINAVGSYTRDNGSTGTANNVDLAANPFYREYTTHVALDEVAKGLPDMHGSGAVRDLREASMLNSGLKTVLAQYASAQTREQQMALIDRLLTEWAKSSAYRTFDQRISDLGTGTFDVAFGWSWETGGGFGVGGGSTSNASPIGPGTSGPTQEQLAQKALLERVKLLEVFNAQNFFNFSSQVSTTSKGDEFTISPSAGMNGVVGASAVAGGSITLTEKNLTLNLGQAAFINSAYESLRQSVYNGLLLQTRLRPYVEAIGVTLNGNGLGLDFSAVATLFQKAFAASHINGLVDLWEFLGQPVGGQGVAVLGSLAESFAQSLTSAEVARINALGLGVQVGTVSRQNLVGTAGNDALLGLAGNGTLSGGDGNDTLSGGIGNDRLFGDAGNDVLVGGTGNDYLSGDAGNDVYRFERGWGQDTVSNYDDGIGRVDTLEFAAGIAVSDIQLSRADDSLVLALKGSTDRITVQNYFYNDAAGNSQLDKIRFADGTALDVAQVKRLVQQGTSGNDTLYGYAVADTLNGGVGNDYLYGNAGDDRLEGGDGNDALYGEDGNDALLGGAGGDTLDGQAGNDSLQGGEGNDYLYGSDGNDTLNGGTGNDLLSGDAGNDVYRFERGWGQDTVSNYDESAGRVDTLEFAAGIAVSDIQLSRADDSLVLALKGSTDRITVQSYFYNDAAGNSRLDKIRFADGTVLDVAQVKRLVQQGTSGNDTLYGYAVADTLNGGVGNDYLYGNAGDDRLEGGDGNDALYGEDGNDALLGGAGGDTLDGQAGNDSLQGGEGNDYLYGSDGNDTLSGGTGNDLLSGDAGNDVYRFERGWGQDTVSNYDGGIGRVDTLEFAAGIAVSDIQLSRADDSLVLALKGSTDRITVQSYFYNDAAGNSRLDKIRFADGTVLDIAQVKQLVQQGTSGNDTLYGYAVADTLSGGGGNDYLYGNAGDDRLEGGDGNDALYGGDGNDALLGGAGGDTLDGQAGNDSLQGGEGNDYLYGSDGNDTLSGGTGNDLLSGDAGNDVYRFERGWGQDTVSNYDGGIGRVDTLEFAAGIAVSDIQLSRADDSLVLALKGSTDRITVQSYFYNDAAGNSRLDKIRFADGTVLDIAQVKRLVQQGADGNDSLQGYAVSDTLSGGAGNDYLYGNAGDDRLEGGDGDDVLYGGDGNDALLGGAGGDALYGQAGNDSLQGGEGNDYLYGSDGNDTLNGGTGNDLLSGEAGNDVYRFERSFGQDTIYNYHSETNTLDQLVFADNITANQLWFRKNGNDLDVSVIGTTDKVSVSNWYSGNNYHLNQVVSADGKTLLESKVQNLVNAMASFGVPPGGESNLTQSQRQQLDVVLAANWQ